MLELYPHRKPYELDARLANGGYVFTAKKPGWLWSSETGLYLACDPDGLSMLLQFGKGQAKINETLLVFPKDVEFEKRVEYAKRLEEQVGVSPIELAEARIRCPRSYISERHRVGVMHTIGLAVAEFFPQCYQFELNARKEARKKSN